MALAASCQQRHARTLLTSRYIISYFSTNQNEKFKHITWRKRISELLMKVHPDHFRDQIPSISLINDKSLRSLNSFLDTAEIYCNPKEERDEKLPLPSSQFNLNFYLVNNDIKKSLKNFHYTIIIPNHLLYLNPMQSSTQLKWRQFTDNSLAQLHELAEIKYEYLSNIKNNKTIKKRIHVNASNKKTYNTHLRLIEEEKVFRRYNDLDDIYYPSSLNSYEFNLLRFDRDFARVKYLLSPEKLVIQSITEEEKLNGFKNFFQIFFRNYREMDLESLVWNRIVLVMSKQLKRTYKEKSLILSLPYNVEELIAVEFIQKYLWDLKQILRK